MKIFDLEMPVRADAARLRWPHRVEVSGEDAAPAGNQHFQDLGGADWDDVARFLSLEDRLVARISQAVDPAAEEALVQAELDGLADLDDQTPLLGLDIGVASAVLALSAHGAIPVASCNGGAFGARHAGCNPYVATFIRPRRFLLVQDWAATANLVVTVNDDGVALLHARRIEDLMTFARLALAYHREHKLPAHGGTHDRRPV